MPGADTPVCFIPTLTTDQMRQHLGRTDFEFEIGCSQLCGLGHYRMRAQVFVHAQEDYEAWMKQAAQEASQ